MLVEDGTLWVQEPLLSCKWAYGDVAVLASEIPNLAGFWLSVVTRRYLATDVRIKMAQSSSTITVDRNWPTQIPESALLIGGKKWSWKISLVSRKVPLFPNHV